MAEAASSATTSAAKAAVVSAVASAASAPSAAGTGASATSSSSGCLICLDDVVPEDVVVLQPCGHVLCTGCMGSYLSAEVWAYSPPWLSVLLQVNDGRTQIRCPKTDCRSDLPFAQLQQYLDRLPIVMVAFGQALTPRFVFLTALPLVLSSGFSVARLFVDF